MKRLSLRSRLVAIFCILIVLAWATSTGISYVKTRKRVRAVFDAQQLLFAQRLEQSQLGDLLPLRAEPEANSNRQYNFNANKALSFAVYTVAGQKLLSDRSDVPELIYHPGTLSLDDRPVFIDTKEWRVLWLQTKDRGFIIAVGQEKRYRDKMSLSIIIDHQVMPWLIMLPFLIAAIIFMISRELAPIKQVSYELTHRAPDDDRAVDGSQLPKEVRPLIDALNSLFDRISSMLTRERRFVSDAAHELRSPLSGLRVQAEVAQLTTNKPEVQKQALENLTKGIERSSRLIDQLLILSRLDTDTPPEENQAINWRQLLEVAIDEAQPLAQQKNIQLQSQIVSLPEAGSGHALLLSILLRNLIDNALRYTHEQGTVNITLTDQQLSIEDNGPGVSDEYLLRIDERFFRPPGQEQTGSGLGLSIVKQIAELHHFTLSFNNRPQGGFSVQVKF